MPKTRCRAKDLATCPTSLSISACSTFDASSDLTVEKYTVIFFSRELESNIGLVCESFPRKELFVLFVTASFGVATCCWVVATASFEGLLLLSSEAAGFLPRLAVVEPVNVQI